MAQIKAKKGRKNPRKTVKSKSAEEEQALNPDEVIFSTEETAETPDNKALATSDPLARYMREISKYQLLTKEQEHALAVRFKETGDPKAAEQLVTANLRFVVKVAAEYTRFGAKLIDLIQEGNVGLMHAVRDFNPYKGVRLITYAVWWIRGYIQEYLMRQYSLVRIGTTASQRKLFYQLQREKEALERLGPDQVVKQLSGRLGIDEDEVAMMQQRLSAKDISLDKPLSDDQGSTLLDLQRSQNEDAIDNQLDNLQALHRLREKVELIRPNLNDKELVVLEKRLLSDEPATLQEIGEKYKITREAVRQIEQRLLEKIRTIYLQEN